MVYKNNIYKAKILILALEDTTSVKSNFQIINGVCIKNLHSTIIEFIIQVGQAFIKKISAYLDEIMAPLTFFLRSSI